MITRSESIIEIVKGISAMHAEIAPLQHDAANPHFGHGYVSLTNIIEATRPLLLKNGLTFTQHPGFRDGLVTVETLLMHTSGEWMQSEAAAPMEKATAQGVGSAITYLRRYALAAILGLGQEDDDGQAASRRGNQRGDQRREQRGNQRPQQSVPERQVEAPREPEAWAFTNTLLGQELEKRGLRLTDVKRVWALAGDDTPGIVENIRALMRRNGSTLVAVLDHVVAGKLPVEGGSSAE